MHTQIPLERPKSRQIYQQACQVTPAGVNSPVRSFLELGITPLVVESGSGACIRDVDGYEYLDYCGSWGALIHGHAHPKIVTHAQKRLALGSTFGITSPVESRLAAKITEHVPSIEKIRFVSSGTEATMSAIRLARGFTGRDLLIKFAGHYHGHSDSLLVQAGSGVVSLNSTSSSAGVPQDFVKHTLSLPFNDFSALREAFQCYGSKIAAIIVEPVAANMGVVLPAEGFLEALREETQKVGALLIFDEVITGFRLGLGGAQEKFGIKPDLTTLGKIIGGGFPAAAFGGRADIMDYLAPNGPVYQAGTLSGNPVAMEAGYQALLLCEQPHFYENLETKTKEITDPIHDLIQSSNLPLTINQIGSLFTLFFRKGEVTNFQEAKQCNLTSFKKFFTHLFTNGVYFSPSQFEANFVSAAHTSDQISRVCELIVNVLI